MADTNNTASPEALEAVLEAIHQHKQGLLTDADLEKMVRTRTENGSEE